MRPGDPERGDVLLGRLLIDIDDGPEWMAVTDEVLSVGRYEANSLAIGREPNGPSKVTASSAESFLHDVVRGFGFFYLWLAAINRRRALRCHPAPTTLRVGK